MTNKKKHDSIFEASVADLLTEANEHELERRDGEWSAFTASVFRRVDEEDLGLSRMTLEDQAINAFRQEVDGELSELSPKFEEAFQKEIEQRIWDVARDTPTISDRVRGLFARLRGDGIGWSLGWAGAMATAMVVVAVNGVPNYSQNAPIAENISGKVSVKRVSFEGTVTVMPADGATVIWLSDDSNT